MEIEHFINEGFGWVCKHCSRSAEARAEDKHSARARFFSEGEAEEKEQKLSTTALARWTSPARRALRCPRCGIEEMVDKA
jgi:DNA-directed RNA polymerase subunit M/transcription elongation factor TFIIS